MAEQSRYLVADGKLPADNRCVLCSGVTEEILNRMIECERPYVKSPGFRERPCTILVMPRLIARDVNDAFRDGQLVGGEPVVKGPLRTWPDCHTELPHGTA